MRVATALLLIVHLLLRAAAVPHVHAAHADVAGHAGWTHVHLPEAAHDHEHHDHEHDGSTNAAPGPHDEPAHEHDHGAIYLDGHAVMATAPGHTAPPDAVAEWLAIPAQRMLTSPDAAPGIRPVRPPGAGAPSFHTLLPHVLRV